MNFKEFINEIIDVPKLVFRFWLSLWIVLLILIFFKVVFNVWYPIIVENSIILKIDDFINKYDWIDIVISLMFYLVSSIFLFQIGIKKIRMKWYGYLFVTISFTGIFFFKTFVNNYLAFLLEMSFGVIIPIVYNLKYKTFNNKIKCILYPIIFNIVISLYQSTLMFVRNINELLSTSSAIIKYTLQMDYYVFLLITLIWEVFFMGNLGWWFFGKDITVLKAELEKEEKKKEPNEKKVLKLKERIDKLEKHN